jgi:uncharacterized membrane protein (DUF2068 family)
MYRKKLCGSPVIWISRTIVFTGQNMKLKFYNGLKLLALFEAAKGILVLVVGAGILTLIHRNIQIEAMDIVQFFHLNPARRYPQIFLKTFSDINNTNLIFLSVLAIIYTVIRMAEAYGLWHDRAWAIWFAVASTALFLPIEIFELYKRITIPRSLVFIVNIALILYLFLHIKQNYSQKQH